MPETIVIETLSWTVVGTRDTDTGQVDLDTVHDVCGLPYIPRSVLSSRLRNAALVALGRPAPPGVPGTWKEKRATAMAEVLGVARSQENRLLYLGDAVLPVGYRRRVKEQYEQHRDCGRAAWFGRQCLELHTDVRLFTEADELGAPVAGTMRHIRGIVPGRAFRAQATWRRAPEDIHVSVLAEMLVCLNQIGHAENSMSGRVRCALDGNPEDTLFWASIGDET